MASSSSTPTPLDGPLEEEDNAADLPLTMAASVILDHLPRDAHRALETAGELEQAKGTRSEIMLSSHMLQRCGYYLSRVQDLTHGFCSDDPPLAVTKHATA